MRLIGNISAAAITLTFFTWTTASAQSVNVPDALKRAIGAVKQVQQTAQPPAKPPTAPQPGVPAGMTPSNPAMTQEPVLWATKAAMLQATRRGELTGIPKLTMYGDDGFAPVLRSIGVVLRTDYGVPPIPRDAGCQHEFTESTKRIMRAATEVHTTSLGERAPDFFNENRGGSTLPEIVASFQRPGMCGTEVLGKPRAHPYRQALLSLMDEYSAATKDYVEEERARRKTAYADQQARLAAEKQAAAEAAAKRDNEARAAEQARIDAERARVEAEQRRRQQIEKNRVAG